MTPRQNDNLSRDIARSDPFDTNAQTAILGRIRQLRTAMPQSVKSDLSANLEMAAMLTQYLIRLHGIGPEDVLQIISRLVGEVEMAFTLPREGVVLQAPEEEEEPAGPTGGQLRLLGQSDRTQGKFLGEILRQQGHVEPEHVEQALQTQKATGVRMGEVLVQMGLVSWDQVRKAVEVQKQLRRALGA